MLRTLPCARVPFVLSLLTVAVASQAQYVSGTTIAAINHSSANQSVSDTKSFYNATPDTYNTASATSVSVSLGGGMDANGYVAGQMGILRASSFAEFPKNDLYETAQDHTEINALDYLTVVDPGLAAGTLVTLNFQYHLSGTFSTPVFELGGAYSASVVGTMLGSSSSGTGQFDLRYENTNGTAPYDLFGTMTARVGDKITFQYGLDTFAYVEGIATVAHQANIDFSHTAIAYAWASDPTVKLVAASGHDYSPAPVPEPCSLAALGLGALGFARRRRAHSVLRR